MIVGLAGYAGSGKDTFADALELLGWHHAKFAGLLKDVALAVDPYVEVDDLTGFVRLSDLVADVGWTKAKRSADVRRFLQRLGTDGVRRHLGEDIWVDATMDALSKIDGCIVISDVRFPNEAQAIHDAGGVVVRIERPGFGPVNGHESESALDFWEFDVVIHNDGSVADLVAQAGSAFVPSGTEQPQRGLVGFAVRPWSGLPTSVLSGFSYGESPA